MATLLLVVGLAVLMEGAELTANDGTDTFGAGGLWSR
jgi:hypothetical protein